jgi:hypothetical protein
VPLTQRAGVALQGETLPDLRLADLHHLEDDRIAVVVPLRFTDLPDEALEVGEDVWDPLGEACKPGA